MMPFGNGLVRSQGVYGGSSSAGDLYSPDLHNHPALTIANFDRRLSQRSGRVELSYESSPEATPGSPWSRVSDAQTISFVSVGTHQ